MSTTSTISVACPNCGDPATVTLTTITPLAADQILEFVCPGGHELDGNAVMHLWVSAHQSDTDEPTSASPL